MFFIFCLVSSFLFLTAEGSGLSASDCQDFTMSSCTYDKNSIIKDTSTSNEEDCQEGFCNGLYQGECTYYVYEPETKSCKLFKDDMTTLFETCNTIGGPKEPEVDDCNDSEDPCKMFLDGECTYSEELEKDEKVDSVEECQVYCVLRDGCQYFVYDKEAKECTLYEQSPSECTELRGPPTPPNTDC